MVDLGGVRDECPLSLIGVIFSFSQKICQVLVISYSPRRVAAPFGEYWICHFCVMENGTANMAICLIHSHSKILDPQYCVTSGVEPRTLWHHTLSVEWFAHLWSVWFHGFSEVAVARIGNFPASGITNFIEWDEMKVLFYNVERFAFFKTP